MASLAIKLAEVNNVENAIVSINYNPTPVFFAKNPEFIEVENPNLANYLVLYSYDIDTDTFTYETDLYSYYGAEDLSNLELEGYDIELKIIRPAKITVRTIVVVISLFFCVNFNYLFNQ